MSEQQSKQARVVWAGGRVETLAVIRESAQTFTTADANETRWWKKTGLRVGALSHASRDWRGFFPLALARRIDAE